MSAAGDAHAGIVVIAEARHIDISGAVEQHAEQPAPAGWPAGLWADVLAGRISYRRASARPHTPKEWAAFLEHDWMPLCDRLRLVVTLAEGGRRAWPDKVSPADEALLAIIPGEGQATPAILDAVADATGEPRIRQLEAGVVNTAPSARAALRRWAAREANNVKENAR